MYNLLHDKNYLLEFWFSNFYSNEKKNKISENYIKCNKVLSPYVYLELVSGATLYPRSSVCDHTPLMRAWSTNMFHAAGLKYTFYNLAGLVHLGEDSPVPF